MPSPPLPATRRALLALLAVAALSADSRIPAVRGGPGKYLCVCVCVWPVQKNLRYS